MKNDKYRNFLVEQRKKFVDTLNTMMVTVNPISDDLIIINVKKATIEGAIGAYDIAISAYDLTTDDGKTQ